MKTRNAALKAKIKPLTNYMKEVLMDCHERELLKLDPYEAGSIKYSVRGLIERGLLETKFHITEKGKKIMAVCLTDTGRTYLNGN